MSWLGYRYLGIALGLVCAARIAQADSNVVEVYAQVRAPDPHDPKLANKAPSLDVTVIGGAKVPLEKFALSTTNQGQKVTLRPDKLREYTEGTETIAIALVINGQEIWVGNDDYETDENAKYPGVLKNLEAAIDKLQLGSAGPPGSKGVVVSYSSGADIKVPMGDLKLITGGALGSQKDYHGKIGTDMVQGITQGLAELSKVSTARKALIVVGDGSDTNNEVAKSALADLKKQAGKQNIQLFAVIYKCTISGEGNVITTLIPTAKTVGSVEGIAAELNGIIARMADRYYLSFPGYDEKMGMGLPWDGRDHDLVLKIDQTELEPFSLTLAPKWALKRGGFPWLIATLIGISAVLMLVFLKILMRKQEPMPVMAPQAPQAPAPEPPKPMAPMKTSMMNANGDQDGFPVVGWLVPLNGVNAYQTWRLKAGLTKIGTAPPADFVVNDGFMSTEHCSITASPAGFTLHDAGSMNGCYVNDAKVQKHDLIDNDVIVLGKTNFKFKSIN